MQTDFFHGSALLMTLASPWLIAGSIVKGLPGPKTTSQRINAACWSCNDRARSAGPCRRQGPGVWRADPAPACGTCIRWPSAIAAAQHHAELGEQTRAQAIGRDDDHRLTGDGNV